MTTLTGEYSSDIYTYPSSSRLMALKRMGVVKNYEV